MRGGRFLPKGWAPAHGWGAAALGLGAVLAPLGPVAVGLPLGLFVMTCLAAPFFPRSGFFLAVTSRGPGEGRCVALTFDDGPDPRVTPRLLTLLEGLGVQGTFFVIGHKAQAQPALVRAILAAGHEVGNHSYRHDPLLMLRSTRRLADEIHRTQEVLAGFGSRPLFFRPPVGITNPRLGDVLEAMGLCCVTFSCRAGDFGNRRIKGLARKILGKARPGAIILLHDVTPPDGDIDAWLSQVEEIIVGLRARGYDLMTLTGLGVRPAGESHGPGEGAGPTAPGA